jgi:hypothetical protein
MEYDTNLECMEFEREVEMMQEAASAQPRICQPTNIRSTPLWWYLTSSLTCHEIRSVSTLNQESIRDG